MTDTSQCQGEHSQSEGNQRPERPGLGTSNQHLETHLAGPTPGSAHVRLLKEKASSMKPLDTRFWHTRKQVLKQVQCCRETSSTSISSSNEAGQEERQQQSQKSHNPSQKLGEFPQEQQLLASPGRRQEGGLQGCSCKKFLTLQETGNRDLCPRPVFWASVLKVVRNSTILVFKLSIFIIKIITSLVKVQMLQHGVKTPLE